MKVQKKKRNWTAPLLAVILALLLSGGCAGHTGEKTVAVLDGEEISLSEAVFYTRMNQLQWERSYVEELGTKFWTEPVSQGGPTFGEELKSQVMDTICQIHLMNAHMEEYQVSLTAEETEEIAQRVDHFMETYGRDVLKEAGADRKLVEKLLTQRFLADKVAEAAVADYEAQVSQEEAALSRMTYCLFSTMGTYDTEGGHREATPEEIIEIREEAEAFARRTKELQSITAAAEEFSHTCVDVFFNDYTNGGAHEAVAERMRKLSPGETDGPIETEEGYYVIQYITPLDEEATAENREMLLLMKKEERCREIYEGWKAEADFVIDQEVWDTVQVDRVLFTD